MKIRIKTKDEMVRDFGDRWESTRWSENITNFPIAKQKFLGKPLTPKEVIDYKNNGYVKIKHTNVFTYTFTKEMMVIEENEGVQTKMKFGNINIGIGYMLFINGNDNKQYEVIVRQVNTFREATGFSNESWKKKFDKYSDRPYPQFFGERTDNGKLVHFNGNDVNKVFKSKEDYEKHIKKNVDHYKKTGMLRGEDKPIDGMLGEISWPEFESTTENIKLKPIHSKRRMAKISTQL